MAWLRMRLFLSSLLVFQAVSTPAQQEVLSKSNNAHSESILKVRAELTRAEIIPTVLDDFIPASTVTLAWPWPETAKYNLTTRLGNTISPDLLQSAPAAEIDDDPTSSTTKDFTYVLTLTDPDAPSRDNPKWSEVCHWIITSREKSSKGKKPTVREVMPYKPPGPPPKTGKHRYVFVVWIPSNRTTDTLYLEKPEERYHWGYDTDGDGNRAGRVGVRKWAKDMGLMPIAANFIYSQNETQ